MRNGSTNLATIVRNPEVVGAGGLMSGCQGSSDGTLLGRCDTAGPMRLDPNATAWVREFVPGQTIALADFRVDGGVATYAVAIAWSDSTVRALHVGGYVWVKKTGATLYTRTPLARDLGANGNSLQRANGDMMAFDPANPNVLWVGTQSGVKFTIDQGDSWTSVSTSSLPLPSGTAPHEHRHIILFDRSSTVTSGRTQRLYIFVPGSGWYRSTNAGAAWSLLAGSPTSAGGAKVHPTTGRLISTGINVEDNGPVNIFDGTSWTVGTRIDGGGNQQLHTVEFDRSIAGLVYGVQTGGAISTSVNSGATWGSLVSFTQNASTVDIPWQVSDSGYRTVGGMCQHPGNGRLRISTGVGCWELRTPPSTATTDGQTILAHGLSRGIENMVTTTIMRAPDGKTAIGMQDKQWMFFGPNELGKSFTDRYGPRRGQILRGVAADYAPEDTDFWVATFAEEGAHCGYTTDFGRTWTLRPELRTQTGGNGGGQIVCLSKDIWLACQFKFGALNSTNRAKNALYLTRDRGLTWTEVVIGNGNAVMAHGDSNQVRISMCKDYSVPGRVYFYNVADTENLGGADSIACVGFWMIDVPMESATAPTVTRLTSSSLYPFGGDYYHMKLRHGGQANTFLVSGGANALGAYRGTISGTTLTLTPLTGTDNLGIGTRFGEVDGISASKGRNGSSTPAIVAVGYRITTDWYDNGIDFSRYGAWESADNGVTWTRIEQFPANAPVSTIQGNDGMAYNDGCASMHKSGELTVTTGGQGAAHRFEQYNLRAS